MFRKATIMMATHMKTYHMSVVTSISRPNWCMTAVASAERPGLYAAAPNAMGGMTRKIAVSRRDAQKVRSPQSRYRLLRPVKR